MTGKTSKTETAPAQPKTETTPAQPKTPKTPKMPKSEPTQSPTKPKAEKVEKVEKPSSKKKEVVVEIVPVVASTAAPVIVEDVAHVAAEFTGFMTKLQSLSALISSLKSEFRLLEKKASRELKSAAKASSKRKRKTGNRSPSGFVKPTLISDELASFLGKSKGTEMARTEVTREINSYIRANQLQDKTNGRRINADTKLSSLLKLTTGEELTYFNLQRYMSPHFAKSAAATANATAVSASVSA
jgi:upstream activation factor subunit UAF30